jgi:hypothetical protein
MLRLSGAAQSLFFQKSGSVTRQFRALRSEKLLLTRWKRPAEIVLISFQSVEHPVSTVKEVGRQMSSNEATRSYESPKVTVVGTLHDLTLAGKTFSPTNDFSYPAIVTSTFGPLNFS